MKPENVVTYTQAAIALHNTLRTTESGFVAREDGQGNVIRGNWRSEESSSMLPVSSTSSNRYGL